jgi:hypothetical protein
MADETRLDRLLQDWQERRRQGQSVTAEELCAGCPELAEPLRKRMRDLDSMQGFLGVTITAAPVRVEGDTASVPLESQATLPPTPGAGTTSGLLALPSSGEPGSCLGTFRILEVLGQGGMGMVLRAEDTVLQRTVAIKVMRPEMAANPDSRERFLREARAAAALNHAHVISIHHVGEQDGVPYLVMPLLKGESLAARLKREKVLPVAEIVRIGREAAEGLSAAHERGLVHRDVKPANLWLEGAAGTVKVLDFGLVQRGGAERLTATGAVMGTPAYMAPEQVRGEKVDARCDLFSLGAVLYEMSTGQQPFKGSDTLALLASLALDEPAAPQELRPDLPPGLARLIQCLLAKSATERPGSAHDVAEALEALAAGGPLDRTTATWPAKGASGRLLVPAASRKGARRRLVWLGVAGGLAGAALGALLWGLLRPSWQQTKGPGSPGESEKEGQPPRDKTALGGGEKPAREEPLSGKFEVLVWSPSEDGPKRRLPLHKPGALPVRNGEVLRFEVVLEQKGYAYILWIDSVGAVTPLYPWNREGNITVSDLKAPPEMPARERLISPPPRKDKRQRGWEMEGESGLETILLLARRTPLPRSVRLAEVLGKLRPAPLRDPLELVERGLDGDEPTERRDQQRRPKKEAKVIDDSLERMLRRLAPHFEMIRAVRFGHVKE